MALHNSAAIDRHFSSFWQSQTD